MTNTPLPTRGLGDVSVEYGDDQSHKEVYLQVTGLQKDPDPNKPRHVLIYWHQYHYPDTLKVDSIKRTRNQTISLGVFTFEQREQLLEFAADVEYNELSTESHVWMHKPLPKMVEEKLISLCLFKIIREMVPLRST
ncbi:hypothetical protein AZE42_08106 [Rhizopogon vesiculosus]|uniref:Uncharacterized protein n=1 Tax=Rhizopogon vesiculosus TaxID=180088 RepID=A0A1J8Q299_9AGAM|nr:hypothetical protein AZE42_08106 [Rhizopogon vesiculosus]